MKAGLSRCDKLAHNCTRTFARMAPMRTVVALLLAANLALFAYTEFERMSGGESDRLQHQLFPEKLRLLTPQQVAGLGPAKAAQLANVCLEWGGFADTEKSAALAALEPLQLGRQLSQRRIESTSAYWVYVPPLRSKTAAEKKVTEIKAQGLKDFFILTDGAQKNAISLGVFKTEDAANKFLETVQAKGVNDAKSGARTQTIQQTVLVLRDPQPAQAEQLQQLRNDFAGSEVKIGPCDDHR
jgi:SPOR domain